MRYVTNLPSTPQMARYTAARSSYTDPTVSASPTAWWGSSLGGCGCGFGQATTPAATPAPAASSNIGWWIAAGLLGVLGFVLLTPKRRRKGSSQAARDRALGRRMRAVPYKGPRWRNR